MTSGKFSTKKNNFSLTSLLSNYTMYFSHVHKHMKKSVGISAAKRTCIHRGMSKEKGSSREPQFRSLQFYFYFLLPHTHIITTKYKKSLHFLFSFLKKKNYFFVFMLFQSRHFVKFNGMPDSQFLLFFFNFTLTGVSEQQKSNF